MGFDAFISLKFAEAGTRGLKTYLEKTLTDGLRYKPETYRIYIGGEEEGEMQEIDAFLIACANASQYGNNAYIAPDASMKDGLMDVIVLQPFSMLEAPIVAMQLFQRTLPNNSHVKTYRTNRLCIERTADGPAHCDGDPYETTARINVELIPAGLRAIINEKALLTPAKSSVQSNMLLRTLEPFQKQITNFRNQVNSLFDIF